MKKLAALIGTAALALTGVGAAQAKNGADDAHPHKHHRVHHARHGADDGANHVRHGADDGPNHT